MALFECGACLAVYGDYYPTDDTCRCCKKGFIRIVTEQEEKTITVAPGPVARVV